MICCIWRKFLYDILCFLKDNQTCINFFIFLFSKILRSIFLFNLNYLRWNIVRFSNEPLSREMHEYCIHLIHCISFFIAIHWIWLSKLFVRLGMSSEFFFFFLWIFFEFLTIYFFKSNERVFKSRKLEISKNFPKAFPKSFPRKSLKSQNFQNFASPYYFLSPIKSISNNHFLQTKDDLFFPTILKNFSAAFFRIFRKNLFKKYEKKIEKICFYVWHKFTAIANKYLI